MMRDYILQIEQGENLSHDQITVLMELIMSGQAPLEDIKSFLLSLNKKGPTVEEITTAFGEMGVAKYKHPERIEPIDELPLTTTGKVRHQALRERLTGS